MNHFYQSVRCQNGRGSYDNQDPSARRPTSSLLAALGFWTLSLTVLSTGVAQGQSASRVLDQYRVASIALKGRVIGDPDQFATPSSIEWVDSQLVVIDRDEDLVISVVDPRTGTIIRKFGRRGEGPGDFRGAWSLLVPNAAIGQFWIFDTMLRRLTEVELASDFPRGVFAPSRILPLQSATELNSPVWLADGRIVSSGLLPTGLLAAFDSTGAPLAPLGLLPVGDPGVSAVARQQAYYYQLATDPTRRSIVLYSRHSDRIAVLDENGHLVRSNTPPFGFDPLFKVTGQFGHQAAMTKESRNGYRSIKVLRSHWFALFSGRREDDSLEAPGLGRYVHVYDRQGRLLRVLVLDSDLLDIAVDPDEEFLYGVRTDPLPGIVAYRLPKLPRSAQ